MTVSCNETKNVAGVHAERFEVNGSVGFYILSFDDCRRLEAQFFFAELDRFAAALANCCHDVSLRESEVVAEQNRYPQARLFSPLQPGELCEIADLHNRWLVRLHCEFEVVCRMHAGLIGPLKPVNERLLNLLRSGVFSACVLQRNDVVVGELKRSGFDFT